MKVLLITLGLVASCLAAPLDIEATANADALPSQVQGGPPKYTAKTIKQLLEPVLAMRKYIEDPVLEATKKIYDSEDLSNELANVINAFHTHEIQIQVGDNHAAVVEQVKKISPSIGAITQDLTDYFESKLSNMSPDCQNLITTWEKRTQETAKKVSDYIQQNKDLFKPSEQGGKPKFPAEIVKMQLNTFLTNEQEFEDKQECHGELKTQFPKSMAFAEGPLFKGFVKIAKDTVNSDDATIEKKVQSYMQPGL